MKRYISFFQIFAGLTIQKNDQGVAVVKSAYDTDQSAGRSQGQSQLDIPTYIRQGKVLTSHQ